eukprot:s929_g11.t1
MAKDEKQNGNSKRKRSRSRSRSKSSKSSQSRGKSSDKEAEEKVASTRGAPRVTAPEDLPVLAYRENIIDLLVENRIIVVVGETGSGKTTQIPQYLLDSERFQCLFENKRGLRIAITQPRRVAAVAMARRVSDERGTRLGDVVGYCIRFEDKSGASTRLRYMTDGCLLRECLGDPNLANYDVVILDEAHERSLHTDVLFALMKRAVVNRAGQLRMLVTSATLDTGAFSAYFDCPVLEVPGRSFAVDLHYHPVSKTQRVEAAVNVALNLHVREGPGHILVFLTGMEECEQAVQLANGKLQSMVDSGKEVSDCLIVPLYGMMQSDDQRNVFEEVPEGCRKLVFSTNIAETSLTVAGVGFVVDCGYCKQKFFNPKTGMESLQISEVSQVQAKQRAGRAGRTQHGKCFRLYSEESFNRSLLKVTVPEILRSNLASVSLQMKAMGIEDVVNFDFMEPPDRVRLVKSLRLLFLIGALDVDGKLTALGESEQIEQHKVELLASLQGTQLHSDALREGAGAAGAAGAAAGATAPEEVRTVEANRDSLLTTSTVPEVERTSKASKASRATRKTRRKTELPAGISPVQTTDIRPQGRRQFLKQPLRNAKQAVRHFFRYEPFNEYENKVRVGEFKSGRFARKFDFLGGSVKHPPCDELPRTTLGGVVTLVFVAIILTLVIRGFVQAATSEMETVNLEYVSINMDCVNEDLNSLDPNACQYEVEAEMASLAAPFYWISQMLGEAATPSLDVPVMEVRMSSKIQFFERSRETSLHKVVITDMLGLSESSVSSNSATPPTLSAVDSIQAELGSFHESSAVLEPSLLSNKTIKSFEDMQGSTASHMFDDTMMYWYLKRNIFQSLTDFFEHKVALFLRFDRDQLRQLKTCQLQVGLINQALFNLVKDNVKEDRRLFGSFPFFKSNPFCWKPDNWNELSHRFAPRTDESVTANLVTLEANLKLGELLEFLFDTEWTVPKEQIGSSYNLKLRTKLEGECDGYEEDRIS